MRNTPVQFFFLCRPTPSLFSFPMSSNYYLLLVYIRVWKVIRNPIGFVVPPSVIVRQTYVFQLEEKARNQSRNGYPRFTAPYFTFCLYLFGSCSFFRSAYVISKVFFRAFNTAKGYIDEEAK